MLTRFLQTLTTWSNAELVLIKVCLISFGVCAGLYFHEHLQTYLNYFFIVFVITAVWALVLWIKKMKQ